MRGSVVVVVAALITAGRGIAAPATVAETVDATMARPDMAHGRLGVAVLSLGDGRMRYVREGDRLFTAASTTKLVSSGAALGLLGPERRFHTRVYRTGEVRDGVLDGDIVVVAGGDTNLSGRARPDGHLAFVDEDHAYGGMPVAGDPVAPLTRLGRDIAALGIRRVTGTVIVDVNLFAEGFREGGSGTVVSPIVVNDNLIDVVVQAGAAGTAPTFASAPQVAHVRFVNRMTTGAAGSAPSVAADTVTLDGGVREVTLHGSMPAGHAAMNLPYAVDVPSRFAADVVIGALQTAGVTVDHPSRDRPAGATEFTASYVPARLLADIVSPPVKEDVRITLKVSQNLHAVMLPYLIGSVVAGAHDDVQVAGLRRIHDWLAAAGLDPDAAMMADGAGVYADFTPEFMVRYLAFMARQPTFAAFRAGLPVLGRDGTLAEIQKRSAAAAQVFAKTGTWSDDDLLNRGVFVEAKALAGYTAGPDGAPLAFAVYLNKMALRVGGSGTSDDLVTSVAGQTVGGIAAAIHLLPAGGDPR